MKAFCLTSAVLVIGISGPALAGPALDDTAAPAPGASDDPNAPKENPVEYGVGVRLRGVFIPKGEVELFVERAGDNGSSSLGLGLEFTRRRGNVELQLGIEYEGFNPGEGVWIESGKNVATGDSADVVLKRDDQEKKLGWVTFEFTFLNHAPITKNISIRYGGGAGLGIVTGQLRHYNVVCAAGATNENPSPGCDPPVPPFNGTATFEDSGDQAKYNLPPVFPVVNAIIGVQIKPIEKMTINIEGGIRTFLFFGVSSSYFF
ncbi:MAG: hypothetical protein ABI867_18765 [Kofleriaceae bacterium]